jgi:alkanesulfonate monooxygenase SsuD/methylene tetrahydromethanopterin reductase-like flavin-dependent oxidoreductase (luciferase family)
VELAAHLPLMRFGDEPLSPRRIQAAVDAAREHGFAAVSANDHLVFQTPWLDGPAALASVVERSGPLELATTVALAVLRGPVQLAKALTAIDVLSQGRMVAGVGPGSSPRDYELAGIPFEERWKRFDQALAALRPLLKARRPGSRASSGSATAGWPRPTTRRPSASPPAARRCRAAFRPRWPRCGRG